MIESYRDLEVWQLAMDLASGVYRVSEALPRHELYGLASQMQRAAVSVPSNIAEGHARRSTREYLRFVSVALGSLAELETQLLLAESLHGIATEPLLHQADQLGRKLRGLQKSLDRRLATPFAEVPASPAPRPQPRS